MKLLTTVSIAGSYLLGFNFTSSWKYVKAKIIPNATPITQKVAKNIPSFRKTDSGFSQFSHNISEGSGAL
jgi:hypothetical protein